MDIDVKCMATDYERWTAGEISARSAATAIARELIEQIEPAEQELKKRKDTRREELGTLLIRVGEPLEVLGRITRWVEPTTSESASVKQLRALITDLRDQGSPALDGIATRIEACITSSERKGYPLIDSLPKKMRRA